MLQLVGRVLGVVTETMNGASGPFTKTTIHVLDGFQSVPVTVGRDFPMADLPKEGEMVTLGVVVSAFARRTGGAGVQMTAIERVKPTGARVAAPAAASGS